MNIKGLLVLVGIMSGVAMSGYAQQAKPADAAKAKPVDAVVEKVPQLEAEWNNPLPSSQFTVGLHFGDQQAESFGDILVPIVQFKSGLLFINPRGSWNDSDGQEFNLGLGYRHLLPEKSIILGGNVFYDLRNTSLDNTFNQFGCGLEFLSTWIDARVNVYIPETGDKTTDEYAISTGTQQENGSYWYAPTGQGHQITQYGYEVANTYEVTTMQHFQMTESAMEGYDCEIGALLPIPVVKDHADVKLFGGYFDYNAHYGEDVNGLKSRLEIKPMPALYLDAAWYEDEALMGSYYSVGARVSLPFDLANLSRGKNPFAGAMNGFKPGAKFDFASRMTEMVVRDLHVRTDGSEVTEVVEDRQQMSKTLVSTSRKDYNVVLATDVTFVDNDNTSGIEDGSWENPYRQINGGVQNAVGSMVYVRDAAQQYYENVVLREGMTLWGSGAPIYGRGDRFLGGVYPVVNGMGQGPAITLANNVTVAGLEIVTTPLTSPAIARDKVEVIPAGIYGVNVTDVNLYKNYIHGGDRGIVIECDDMSSFTANITENRIVGSYDGQEMSYQIPADGAKYFAGGGISITLDEVVEVDITVANNDVTRCMGSGLLIEADGVDSGMFIARVSGNYSDNMFNGIDLMADGYSMAAGLFVDVTANNNNFYGISAEMYENGLSAALVASHNDLDRIAQLMQNGTGGIPFLGMGEGGASLADSLGVTDLYRAGGAMQANGNGVGGIRIDQESSMNIAALIGAQADGNGGRMIRAETASKEPGIDGAGISVQQGRGMMEDGFMSIAAMIRCQANENFGDGMAVYSSGETLALAMFMDVTANDNRWCGLKGRVISEDGMAAAVVLATDPLLSLVETVTSMPELSESVGAMDMSIIPAYGQVQANRNGDSGIALDVDGYNGAFAVVLDAQANENGFGYASSGTAEKAGLSGMGVEVYVEANDGTAFGFVGSTEALISMVNTILESAELPIDLDLTQVRTLGPLQANGNAGGGVLLEVSADYDSAIGLIAGVEASDNGALAFDVIPKESIGMGMGGGVMLDVNSNDGDAIGALAGIEANWNYGNGIGAYVVSDAMDGEAMLGGINLIANDNFANGVSLQVQSQAPDSSYLVLAGVMANNNFMGSGIDAWVMGEGEVMVAMTAIQANGNGSDGIYLETDTDYGDSSVWISSTAVDDMYDDGDGWNFMGFALISLVEPGAIEANNNGDNGVNIDSYSNSGEIRLNVEDVTASGNGRRGVRAYLETSASGGEIDAVFADIVANDNEKGLRIDAYSDDEIHMLVSNVEAIGNNDNGIKAELYGDYLVDATLIDNTANENGANGLHVEAVSQYGRIDLDLGGNVANDNSEVGIKIKATTYGEVGGVGIVPDGAKTSTSGEGGISVSVTGNEANDNSEDGINIKADASGALQLFGEGNVVRFNGDDGIDVKTQAASGAYNRLYDFGGGVLGSEGYNVMEGNEGYQMERSGAGNFSAQYNYWDGDATPDYDEEYVGNNMNVNNALAVDPTIP